MKAGRRSNVVGKNWINAPYEEQEQSELVFISKIGIALIREIKEAWMSMSDSR